MIKFLFSMLFLLHISEGHAKIYDCFLFFNELDILNIRLHELYDHVDYFVLVEARETFRGNIKPFYFEENSTLYEKFADKIIYVKLEDRYATDNPWFREGYQRNQIMRGLKNCRSDDIILISDLDEIPRASCIYSLLENRIFPVTFEQTLYRFFLNTQERLPAPWVGTCATTYGHLSQTSPNDFRINRINNYPVILNGGWHFTSIGNLSNFILKLESFSHWELDTTSHKSEKFMLDMLSNCDYVEVDGTYPEYVIKNIEYFSKLGLIKRL